MIISHPLSVGASASLGIYPLKGLTLNLISDPASSSAPSATRLAFSLSVSLIRTPRLSLSVAVSGEGSASPAAGGRPSWTSWAWMRDRGVDVGSLINVNNSEVCKETGTEMHILVLKKKS